MYALLLGRKGESREFLHLLFLTCLQLKMILTSIWHILSWHRLIPFINYKDCYRPSLSCISSHIPNHSISDPSFQQSVSLLSLYLPSFELMLLLPIYSTIFSPFQHPSAKTSNLFSSFNVFSDLQPHQVASSNHLR